MNSNSLPQPLEGIHVFIEDGVVVVIDLDRPGLPSVTNRADLVVVALVDAGFVRHDRLLPVVYCDTMGNWDQLVYHNRRLSFSRFCSLRGAKTVREAINAVPEETE